MPQAPKCKICGKQEWRHVCIGKVPTQDKAPTVADRALDKVRAAQQQRPQGKLPVAPIQVVDHNEDQEADRGSTGMGKTAGQDTQTPIDPLLGFAIKGVAAQQAIDAAIEAYKAEQRKKNREYVRKHRANKSKKATT